MNTLEAALAEHGLKLTPTFDGEPQRNGAQWCIGRTLDMGGKTIKWACFGDFSRDMSKQWTDSAKLNHEEQEKVNEAIQEASQKNREAREKHWAQVQSDVVTEWDSFSDLGSTPYLDRKGLTGLFGCRVEAHERGARLIVPARDADGKLWGYQRIYSEKLSVSGTDKIFRAGARKEGCFHLLGKLPADGRPIYLAEGIATAISIHLALSSDACVVSAFDAGNLLHVARSLRAKLPGTPFILCADNDCWPAKDGKIYHTGLKKAERAAQEVGNARIILPQFQSAEGQPTDFDDLRVREGIEEVTRQLGAEPSVAPGVQPLNARNKKGEPTKPGERWVAMALLEHLGDNVLVQDEDVFLYKQGYWEHQSRDGIKQLKIILATLYGPKAGSRDINAAYNYFLIHAPSPKRNMFMPQYWGANFLNGTLHFLPNPGAKPTLVFRPHNREDYHISQLPFEFPGLECLSAKNAEFDAMLDRIFKGDVDKEAKIKSLAQLFGAAIMPCYTKIFFLVGEKGSGKSTVMQLISRLLDKRNISRVDPSQFHGFNMETMTGKLVNMVTDIDLHKPINDSVVKQIIDRLDFRIKRKYQRDLDAPLPPIHIFGGNDLPVSLEGSTGAYERRVVILKFGAFSAEALGAGNYELDFASLVWSRGWEGILAFALRGLTDLIEAKGHFHFPESGKKMLGEWDERSDILGQFLEALEHGEVDGANQYSVRQEHTISRKNLWAIFNSWQRNELRPCDTKNSKWLVNAMRRRKFGEKRTKTERYWVGVGMAPRGDL